MQGPGEEGMGAGHMGVGIGGLENLFWFFSRMVCLMHVDAETKLNCSRVGMQADVGSDWRNV